MKALTLGTVGMAMLAASLNVTAAAAQDLGVGPMPDPNAVERFGDAGQLYITSAFRFDLTYSKTGDADGQTILDLSPSVGYFIIPSLVVGGTVSVQHSGNLLGSSAEVTSFRAAPFAGYNFWVADVVSLVPQLSLGYSYSSLNSGNTDVTGWALDLGLRVPVLFHPVPHLFMGLAPFGVFDLVAEEGESDERTNRFGVAFEIGGWF